VLPCRTVGTEACLPTLVLLLVLLLHESQLELQLLL